MTRRFLDDVRADLSNLMTDNTQGLIEASSLLSLQIDVIDSVIQDECALQMSTRVDNYALTDVMAPLLGAFDGAQGGDAEFLKVDVGAGTITTATIAGYSYDITGIISFEGGANDEYAVQLLVDGVPYGFKGSLTAEGPNDPVEGTFRAVINAATADAVLQFGIQSQDATDTVDILDAVLYVEVQPTNNP